MTTRRRIIHTPVKIENMDANVCRAVGGKVTSDGKCMVRMTINENKPREIEIEGIDDSEEIRD